MQIIRAFWKTIGWAALVLILSAWSGEKINQVIALIPISNVDKIAHFGLYFVFTFLMMYDFYHFKYRTFPVIQVIVFSVATAVAFGGAMEILQGIPRLHRTTDIFDFLANTAGSFTAVIFYKPINLFLNRIASIVIKPPRNYSL
jgi:glycopeptide antibiotics resistance protein